MSLRFRVVFALSCAVLTLLAFTSYAGQVRAEAEKVRSDAIARYGGEVVSLVVTNRQIEAGETVSSSDVSKRDWVSDLAPDGALTSADDVVGKKLTVAAAKGSPVTRLNLREDGEGIEVPPGHISIGVAVGDRVGLAPDTLSGTRVVAYSTTEKGTTLLASNIVVLSLGKSGSGALTGANLAVMPDDVAKVLSASAAGDLRLVVPADDVTELPTGGAIAAPTVPKEKGAR